MRISRLCGQVQASKRFGAHICLPEHYRSKAVILQHTFCCPKGIAGALRSHPQQAVDVDAPGLQRLCVRNVRRLYQRNAPRLGQFRQDRLEQLEFANPGLLHQQFNQAGARPALIRQFPVQLSMAAGQGGNTRDGQLACTPDIGQQRRIACPDVRHRREGSTYHDITVFQYAYTVCLYSISQTWRCGAKSGTDARGVHCGGAEKIERGGRFQ